MVFSTTASPSAKGRFARSALELSYRRMAGGAHPVAGAPILAPFFAPGGDAPCSPAHSTWFALFSIIYHTLPDFLLR
jgi:hypothetical protein